MYSSGLGRRIARPLAAAILSALSLCATSLSASAQAIPSKIEIETLEVITHGVSCRPTAQITVLGQSILLANTKRICANANDRTTPVDQGWAFPANGSKTQNFTCSIDAGHSPLKSCSNGERLKLVGMRFTGAVKTKVRQTLASRLTSSGVSLDYKASEQQTFFEQNGPIEVAMERNWKYDVRFENGGCRLVSVSRVETQNGQNRAPLSIRPTRCKVIG